MTTVTEPVATVDEQIATFAETVFGNALGAFELAIAHLGRAHGLYAALRGGGGLTAGELAVATGVDERYTREWLEHQAVAGVLTVEDAAAAPTARRYGLPEAHAVALLDEEHPAYAGALVDVARVIAQSLGTVSDAFRTGAGVPYAAYGLHDMQAGFSRPLFAASLTGEWLPAVGDIHARLEAGEALRIADFGCGEGWAAIYLAEAYPAATVHGYDLDDASIANARRHAAERGVGDRVSFELRDVTAPDFTGRYDLVMACEFIHDLADPVAALAAMRRVTAPDGAVFIIDENAAENFAPDGNPVERLLYAFSILHCLPVGRCGEHSAETGTVMRPDAFARYCTEAGFERVDVLPVEHDFYRFYRPVP